jgi:hypothetical protein
LDQGCYPWPDGWCLDQGTECDAVVVTVTEPNAVVDLPTHLNPACTCEQQIDVVNNTAGDITAYIDEWTSYTVAAGQTSSFLHSFSPDSPGFWMQKVPGYQCMDMYPGQYCQNRTRECDEYERQWYEQMIGQEYYVWNLDGSLCDVPVGEWIVTPVSIRSCSVTAWPQGPWGPPCETVCSFNVAVVAPWEGQW